MTLAPLTPSQDVTRYQAKLMPPPIFDLDRKDEPSSLLAILFRRLAFLLPFRRSSLFRARYGRTVVKE
jgi:hypothetical protein